MQVGIGELFSVSSAACWAVGVILYKQLGNELPPVALNLLKNGVVVALMVPTVLIAHGLALPQITGWSLALTVLSGILGISVADTLYFRALNTLGAGRIGVLGNLFSPCVILLSFFFLDERLSLLQFGGFVLVMFGVLLVNRPVLNDPLPASQLRRGLLYGVTAVALNAAGVVMIKPVLEQEPFFWVCLLRLLAALIPMLWLWRWLPAHHRMPSWRGVPWRRLVIAAVFGQYVAMLFWLAGYKYTSASVASILNETASIFILLFAWAWLTEPLGRRKLIGVAFTFGGVGVMLM
ncbi:MAG: DMT family transporter [Lysobacterales bacterium]